MIALGGWGDTVGFTEATRTDASIAKFADDVNALLGNTGADGVGESRLIYSARFSPLDHITE